MPKPEPASSRGHEDIGGGYEGDTEVICRTRAIEYGRAWTWSMESPLINALPTIVIAFPTAGASFWKRDEAERPVLKLVDWLAGMSRAQGSGIIMPPEVLPLIESYQCATRGKRSAGPVLSVRNGLFS